MQPKLRSSTSRRFRREAISFRPPIADIGPCPAPPLNPQRTARLIVVFDIGNVLLRWDRRYLYRKIFDDEERMERFLATALAMDFVSHTDVAKDFAAAVAARAKSFPEFAKELHMFHE